MRACKHCGTIVAKGETPCSSVETALNCVWPTKEDRARLRAAVGANVGAERRLLIEVIELQAKHYGNGMATHLALIGLAEKIRTALAVGADVRADEPLPEKSADTSDT